MACGGDFINSVIRTRCIDEQHFVYSFNLYGTQMKEKSIIFYELNTADEQLTELTTISDQKNFVHTFGFCHGTSVPSSLTNKGGWYDRIRNGI
jgi:hypothetical protein